MSRSRRYQLQRGEAATGSGKVMPAYGRALAERRFRGESIPLCIVATEFSFWQEFMDRVVIPHDRPIDSIDLSVLVDLNVLLVAGRATSQARLEAIADACLGAGCAHLMMWCPEWTNVVPIGRLAPKYLVRAEEEPEDVANVYRALLEAYGEK